MTDPAEKTNPAETPRALVIERVFPHSPEKLWRALTESPLLAQWMMKNDFEPVPGRKFQFRADAYSALNHPLPKQPNNTCCTGNFGSISGWCEGSIRC